VRYFSYRCLIAVPLAAFLVACVDQLLGTHESAQNPSLSAGVAAAYAALRTESVFASSAVGYVGMPSRQGRHLRTLLAQRNAPVIFEHLWREAAPAGRLYALIGLYLTAPEHYARLAPAAMKDQAEITMMFGCILTRGPAATVAAEIEHGTLAREFLPDGDTARREALFDSLEARLSRRGAPPS